MNPAARRAASKLAAVVLSAALLIPGPVSAAELVVLGDVGAHIGTLSVSAPLAPEIATPLAVGSTLLISPQTFTPAEVSAFNAAMVEAPAAFSGSHAFAAQAAVQRHPVISLINELEAKGVALPERLATRSDALKLLSAAEAMPSAALREKMTALAHAAIASHSSGGAGAFSAAFDNALVASSPGALPAVAAPSLWRRLSTMPGVPSGLKKRFAAKAEKLQPTVAIDPVSRELSPSQVRWTAPVEQLPASTKDLGEATRTIVGQDGARENIEFGLKLKEDPSKKGSQFNLYVSGPEGSGRETAVREIVTPMAKSMETPTDLVTATNFDKKSEEPILLELASGQAPVFQAAVDNFIENFGMAVMQAMNSPEILKQKKTVEAKRDQANDKRKADLDAAIEEIRLEVPSAHNEWGVKVAILEGRLVAFPTYRAKGTTGPFISFGKKEEIEAAVKSGQMTMAEFQTALKAAQAEGKALMDDFKKVEAQNALETAKTQLVIEMLNRQAALSAASEMGQQIFSTVAEDRDSTPEHEAWAKSADERVKAFNAEVSEVVVNGKYGFILNRRSVDHGAIGLTHLVDGKLVPMDDASVVGEEDIKAILAAAKPYIERLKTLLAELDAEYDKLHENDPPYEAKAVDYVHTMLSFAATNYQAFLPHAHEKDAKPHFEPEEMIRVDVQQTNEPGSGAPVIYESNPTYVRMFGKAEGGKKRMMMDGMAKVAKIPAGPEIETGSFVKARGGYLILDVMQVLREPGAWQALMQAIRNGEAEVAEEGLIGLYSNGDKYHIPGKTKIILIGDPHIRMLLEAYDRDFAAGFQAPVAEFESKLRINKETIEGYLDFMKNVIRKAKGLIMDFEQDGIAALLEASARDMDSNKKLSAQFGISDVRMRQASQVASDRIEADPSSPKGVIRADIEKLRERDLQSERVHAKSYQELLAENIFILDNSGAPIVGQINGLAVMGSFGVPMRKTFQVAPGGNGIEVISEDRNTGNTGPSYNKGIEVINGFINSIFPSKKPWSARVRISAEQNYGGIDGDSATSTQIYGVLSALSGVGIKPNIALTGSADQFGHVQAIGGVNEKIEGFFDLCKMRGLTGDQGVMIPMSNVGDLMLKPEVVVAVTAAEYKRKAAKMSEAEAKAAFDLLSPAVQDAVRNNQLFHLYAVDNVKDGIEIMTGVAYNTILQKALSKLKTLQR